MPELPRRAHPVVPADDPSACPSGSARSASKAARNPASNSPQLPTEGLWTSPGASDASWKLLDVNLIIVGSGPVAEQLLQRRNEAGGRACLLWTHVSPQPIPNGTLLDHDLAPFDEETFIWQPPPADSSCEEVIRLQRKFGSWDYGYMRSGPDVVALPDGGRYELLLDSQDRVVGIRVLVNDVLSWQMSGAVMLADATGVDSEGHVQQVNVSVQQEEAKPLIFTPMGGMSYLAGVVAYILGLILSTGVILINERSVQPQQVDWWWVAWRGMTFGGQVWTQVLVDGLLGYKQPFLDAAVVTFFGAVVWSMGELLITLFFQEWRPMYFVHQACLYEMSCLFQLASSFLRARWGRMSLPKSGAYGRAQDTRRQFLWTAFMFSLNAVLLLAQYFIITSYMYLEGWSNILAGIFLGFGTSASELLAVGCMELVYTKLIWPRAGDAKRIIYGDQHLLVSMMASWAHSLSEGTRLVSLVSVAVRSPGWRWDWLGSVLFIFMSNVVVRHGYHLTLYTRVVPKRMQTFVKPGCYVIIHRHSRFSCGYHRFVFCFGYMAYRLIWLSGPDGLAAPFFNAHSLVLVFVIFMAELVEDALSLLRLLPLDPWRENMKHAYEPLDPFHPKQAMCKDRRGTHVRQAPLRLHGTRPQHVSQSLAMMQVSTSITAVSCFLYVGAGFWLGLCPDPIPLSLRLQDSFWWSQPLTCS